MRTISESVSVRLYHLDDGEWGAASTLFYGPLGEAMVIANAQPTPFDGRADAVLRGSLGDVLPGLVALV